MSIFLQLVNKITQYGKEIYVFISYAQPELRFIQIGILNAVAGRVMRIDHKRKGNREFNDLIRNRQNTPLKDLIKLLDNSLMRFKKGK